MSHPRPWKSGDHLVICDGCGAQRYRSQCDYTWDNYLMCHLRGCWYEKHPIFEKLPVFSDPYPVVDARPDQASGDETYADNIVGMITTFSNCDQFFNALNQPFNDVDGATNYVNLN